MSTRAILHVGMPKCGSSALQTALSLAPEIDGARRARYVAFQSGGLLRQGARLTDRAIASDTGYVVSARAEQLLALNPQRIGALREALAAAAGDGALLLLSNEGWGNEYADFRQHGLLGKLQLDAEVVVYVRPQVGWCNSAWWQWGAWNPRPFAKWLDKQLTRIQWGDIVTGWRAVPGVRAVHARLLPADILGDFCALAGIGELPAVQVNASLPEPLLRLFQRHRELRSGPHESAIEFCIGRHLRIEGETPWVLGRPSVRRIIDECRAGNEQLLAALAEPDRERMRSDARWWSAEAWADRAPVERDAQPADAAQTDALAAQAIAALVRLDAEHRELQLRHRRLARRAVEDSWSQRLRRWLGRG